MVNDCPLKLMRPNPVGAPDYDGVFADMARTVKRPGTEVHVAEARLRRIHPHRVPVLEAVVLTGIVRAARTAAADGFDALAIG